jgi:RNA polymerase sigma factor for flagellar operon FliA
MMETMYTPGDHAARRMGTIEGWVPIVHEVVTPFLRKLPPNVTRDDLVAAGMCGVFDAMRKNVAHVAMDRYMRVRIRCAILDELRAQDWLSRRMRRRVQRSEPSKRLSLIAVSEVEDLDRYFPDEGPSPFSELVRRRELAVLAKAMATLPEREQGIVVAYYFEGRKIDEIAQTQGVVPSAISHLHTQAIRRLRSVLAKSDGELTAVP